MGVSIWQLLIILVILLLIFGPNRIEGIGNSLGKAVRGFKKGMNEAESQAEDPNDKKDQKDS